MCRMCLTCLEVPHPVLVAAQGGVITKGEVVEVGDPEVGPVDLLEDLQPTDQCYAHFVDPSSICVSERPSHLHARFEAPRQGHEQHHTV